MKALVVSTNRYRNPAPVLPFGACLVAEAAERAGHAAALLDLMFERDPVRALESALDRERPGVIGLSVRNLDNNDAQHPRNLCEELAPLMAAIRRKTPAPVLLGGAAVGLMPEELLRYTSAAWASLGDGEVVFPARARAGDLRGARARPLRRAAANPRNFPALPRRRPAPRDGGRRLRRAGNHDRERGELLKPAFYFAPGVDPAWLEETLRRFTASHLNCVSLESASLPLLPAIQRLAGRLGVRPPLWRHTRALRRTLRLFNRKF